MTDETPSIQTFSCPTCGAPLDPGSGYRATLRCPFCKNVVIVPEGLHTAEAQDAAVGGEQTDAEARAAIAEARQLIQAGNKIEAIKRLRATFNIGLKEAKDMADNLQAGASVEIPALAQTPAAPPDQAMALAEITRLATQGNKLEAIKLFRETFDVGLADAKSAVEAIMLGQSFDLTRRPAVVMTTTPTLNVASPGMRISSPVSRTVKRAAAAPAVSGIGCFITLMILIPVVLAIAVPIGAILFTNRSISNPLNIVSLAPAPIAYPPAILLSTGPDTPPDVIATAYDSEADTRAIVRLDIAKRKSVWQADPFEAGITNPDSLLTDGRLVYVLAETHLMAYQVEDGSLAWQASLPDRISYCEHGSCFRLRDDKLFVMTTDDSLLAFDTQTGVTVWNRRLNGYSDWIEFFHDTIAVIDRDPETLDYSLYFYDLATGDERYRLTPACKSEFRTEGLDYDAAVFFDENEDSLYLLFGWSPGCVQKWLPESAQIVWQHQDEEGFFALSDVGFLPSAEKLYFVNEGVIWETDRNSGETQQFAGMADYELLPLAMKGDLLLVRATNTRGTRKYELWGVNGDENLIPTDGQRVWQINFGEDRPLDPPDEYVGSISEGDMAWTWRLLGEDLILIKAKTAPNEFVIETIDPLNGELVGQKNVAIQTTWDDSYSVPTILDQINNDSLNSLIWLNLDARFFAIDLQAGNIAYEWR